jgi:signal transduction histidine kinase
MRTLYRTLFLEPRPDRTRMVADLLAGSYLPSETTWVDGLEAFDSALRGGFGYDLVFLDHALPAGGFGAALASASRHCPDTPVLVFCEGSAEAEALESLQDGATDVLAWDRLARLVPAVRRALAEVRATAARKEAEAALARLGALVRTILESTSEGILVADLAGKVTAYNRKFISLCGIPDYVLAPMELEQVIQFLMGQFKDPEALVHEMRLLTTQPDQEASGLLRTMADRDIEETGRPYRQGSQVVGRFLGFRDVTDRERSAERLTRLASSQRALLEAARHITLWHAGETGLALSEAAKDLFGLDSGRLPGSLEALVALVHPEDQERLRQALAGTAGPVQDVRVAGPAGSWRPTRWTIVPDAGGQRRGSILDRSDQDRLQHLAIEKARAQWMRTLAGNFARTLRTPVLALASLLGPASKDRAGDPAAAAAGRAEELRRMLELLDQAALGGPAPGLLLDLSEVTQRIGPWVQEALEPGITLTWSLAEGLPALPLNPRRMEPLVMNLLKNAQEAMEGHGGIEVRTGFAGDGTEGPRVFLEVRDQGPGIPPQVQAQMFDPFFSTRPGARGLGLTLVRSIVDSYGGEIQVETGPLRGTSVKVLLPVP